MTASKRKFKFGSDQFPILFEGHGLQVYTNGSGEIFVENTRNEAASIRIGAYGDELRVTAHDGQFTPWAINGLPAFLVRGRRK